MATVTYSVKNTEIRVNVGAKDTSASICWVGITKTVDDCWTSSEEGSYCESVYIGENTDCTNDKVYTGTFLWHGITIYYEITQAHADCPPCPSYSDCEIVDYLLEPYYLPYATKTDAKIYYQYWLYSVDDDCNIIRTLQSSSITISFSSADTKIDCDAESRTIESAVTLACNETLDLEWYVKMPDDCCNDTTDCICYAITDINYSPSIVPSNGAVVSYYFDYKKIHTEHCVQKVTFGRYSGEWTIDPCDKDDDTAALRCCRNHTETIQLSALTSDWNDKILCNNKGLCTDPPEYVSSVTLSIVQAKDPSYSGDCGNVCEPDVGYCVTKDTIKTYYKNESNKWVQWGHSEYNGDTLVWIWDDNDYELPWFGGNLKVEWNYSAFTIYDDCTTGLTTGNLWEDVYDITPYEGDDCKGDCGSISFTNESADRCNGGTVDFSFSDNTDSSYTIIEYPITFKKAPCELSDKDKFPPSVSAICSCDTSVEGDDGCDCNKFEIKYKQEFSPCDDGCDICIKPHNEIVYICSKCGYKIGTDKDAKPYKGKCPICDETFKNEDKVTLSESVIYYFPEGGGEITDPDAYDTDCTLKIINKPSWATATLSGGNMTLTTDENKGSDRKGGITFQLNGEDCYDTIVISQMGANEEDPHGVDPDADCDCTATFDVFPTHYNLSANGGFMVIGSYIFDDCVKDIGNNSCSITADSTTTNCSGTVKFYKTNGLGWIANLKFEDNKIWGEVGVNIEESARSTQLIVTHKDKDGNECTPKTITITQDGGGSECSIVLTVEGDPSPGGIITVTHN